MYNLKLPDVASSPTPAASPILPEFTDFLHIDVGDTQVFRIDAVPGSLSHGHARAALYKRIRALIQNTRALRRVTYAKGKRHRIWVYPPDRACRQFEVIWDSDALSYTVFRLPDVEIVS